GGLPSRQGVRARVDLETNESEYCHQQAADGARRLDLGDVGAYSWIRLPLLGDVNEPRVTSMGYRDCNQSGCDHAAHDQQPVAVVADIAVSSVRGGIDCRFDGADIIPMVVEVFFGL